ncbi:LysR family transcriptional regulator [Microbulbifer rhizosphaerae]|uniref:DNA-binding transcriptional LysR family regulator n=1 Tax=Microbulbifer rhizosphaerae TaxID=1562603 RepID=A0A7W4W9D4_9GAMM|nr:LysR family transcriptional regulator [Microbulbifer rhizosphaerae]MBB3060093.1 DNA-binding transcriptional LysR family regulator [Microbulbifer rhizosphaerae]
MSSPLTLDALRILDAIDRRKSFAAAAEELYRVPSAISYTINKLEEDLGVKLFDRSRRKAELTAVGRLVLEQGRQILTASEELAVLARQAATGWEAELRICVDSAIGFDTVYSLIGAFQEFQPRTEVRLIEEVLAGSWDALNAQRCDLVIGAAGEPPGQGFSTLPLGALEFEFAVAMDHPLTQMPQPLSMELIRQYPTVVVADSSRYLPARSSGLLDGRNRIVVDSIQRKIDVQARGLGVGYLPLNLMQKELHNGTLQIMQLAESRPAQPICAAWHSSNRGKGLAWFIMQLRGMRFDARTGLISDQASE